MFFSDSKGKNFLAIWQRDLLFLQRPLRKNSQISFLENFAKEFILVAMEPSVIDHLRSAKLECVFADSFLSIEQICSCRKRAQKLVRDWVAMFESGAPPSLLLLCVELQVVTLFTAEALAQAWVELGIHKVYALQHGQLRTHGYWLDGDIPQAVWTDVLKYNYKPLHVDSYFTPKKKLFKRLRALIKKYKQYLSEFFTYSRTPHLVEEKLDFCSVKDSIVVFLFPGYAQRDMHIVEQLKKSGSVNVFLFGASEEQILEEEQVLGAHVFPVSAKIDTPLLNVNSYLPSLFGGFAHLPLASEILEECILRYHTKVSAEVAWLKQVFSEYRPSVVCSSQIFNIEHRYYERACLDMKIPVLGIPHAAIQDVRAISFKADDLFLSAVPSTLFENYASKIALSTRVCSMQGLFTANEYPTNENIKIFTELPIVLFVYGVCGDFPSLAYYDGPFSRVSLLKELSENAKKLKLSCTVCHKLHPLGLDKQLLDLAGIDAKSILPLNSDLQPLLDKTTVMVSVNYASSPSQQAIVKGVPIIHLYTTKLDGEIYFSFPPEKAFFDKGIKHVSSPQELWEIVEKLLFDPLFKKEFLDKQNKCAELFLPTMDIDIGNLVAEVIENPAKIFDFPLRGTAVNSCVSNMPHLSPIDRL